MADEETLTASAFFYFKILTLLFLFVLQDFPS